MKLNHARIIVQEARYVEALETIAAAEAEEAALRAQAVEAAEEPTVEDAPVEGNEDA